MANEMQQDKSHALGTIKRSRVDATVSSQRPLAAGGSPVLPTLPSLRFEVLEASRILRMSRAALYIRINRGAIKAQKDGARTYITLVELERYVASCD